MPEKQTFRENAEKVIGYNKTLDFWTIHTLLHEGRFEHAVGWANDIGLNTPPDQNPLVGFPLTVEQKVFLQETLDSHQPTETGLPDHDY